MADEDGDTLALADEPEFGGSCSWTFGSLPCHSLAEESLAVVAACWAEPDVVFCSGSYVDGASAPELDYVRWSRWAWMYMGGYVTRRGLDWTYVVL